MSSNATAPMGDGLALSELKAKDSMSGNGTGMGDGMGMGMDSGMETHKAGSGAEEILLELEDAIEHHTWVCAWRFGTG